MSRLPDWCWTMREQNGQKPFTWRQLLRVHGPAFLTWLQQSQWERNALKYLTMQLADFLIDTINCMRSEVFDAPIDFWSRIPDVRSACSDAGTFEKPFAVEAYAYVHLLERYRRTFLALKHLTKVAVLPHGSQGVRVLDVGTGPAPALYAVDDFYRALDEFAQLSNVPALRLPRPELNCIERSQQMVWFFHRFSEFCGRAGPFGPVFSEFDGLSLQERRAWHQHQNEVEVWWDPETQEYEEIFDPAGAAESANSLFRYRLVIFSNFLTLEAEVDAFESKLRALFQDLRPGAVVILLGATGDTYQRIYAHIAALARKAGLREARWHTDSLGRIDPNDEAAQRIKESQYRVYQHLESLVGPAALNRSNRWPDYWNPNPSPKARPRFALRIFRRGRWPKQ
jgi:hypothetical protein